VKKHYPKGVIVFDRDGTLIEDAGQHNDIERLKFLPDVFELITMISRLDFGIAIASNQSGLESKKFSEQKMIDFNRELKLRIIESTSTEVDLIVVCPHLQSSGCGCRKPKTRMFDVIESSGLGKIKVFIGDQDSDRLTAQRHVSDYINVSEKNIFDEFKKWLSVNESL
jgi:HAD superfamily hydrolase (TIGR01662 family)